MKHGLWHCLIYVFMLCLGFLSVCDVVASEQDELWEVVLAAFVDQNGLVDYAGLKRNPEHLDAYTEGLSKTGPKVTPRLFTTRADSFAFWLNAYNAFVLKGVAQTYPVGSVKEILPEFGFFKQKRFKVDGRELTLDEIEHTILRTQFKDPRIHAAINCAALSCPKLRNKPFKAKYLERQLQESMQEMVRSSDHANLDHETRVLYLSQIFNWFQSDFTDWLRLAHGKSETTSVDYVALFMNPLQRQFVKQTPDLKIVFREYDWSLNDQNKRK